MASRKLEDLSPELMEKAHFIRHACQQKGNFDLLIYCTLRPLEEQARLYRQSRSRATIDAKMRKFKDRGFGYLADIIESVGPCNGSHVTNAAPGESWHNYGLAFDAVPLIGGKPVWSYENGKQHWDAYGESVRQAGIYWAGDWTGFREYPHSQMHQGSNPLKLHSPEKINEMLVENGLL